VKKKRLIDLGKGFLREVGVLLARKNHLWGEIEKLCCFSQEKARKAKAPAENRHEPANVKGKNCSKQGGSKIKKKKERRMKKEKNS